MRRAAYELGEIPSFLAYERFAAGFLAGGGGLDERERCERTDEKKARIFEAMHAHIEHQASFEVKIGR